MFRYLLGSVLALTSSCVPTDHSQVGQIERSVTTAEIIELVEELPPWSRTVYGTQEVAQLNAVVTQLRTYSIAELEEAIAYIYLSGDLPRNDLEDSKTFLILRALFKVPTSESASVAKSFGGWIRPELFLTSPPTHFNLLWPLSVNTSGHVTSVAPYMGYTGTWYDAVAEFYFFKEKYGLR